MSTKKCYYFRSVLLLAGLVFWSCENINPKDVSQNCGCSTVINIEGEYQGTGECVVTNEDGSRMVITVSGETDIISRVANATTELYQISIKGGNDFHELEIGTLKGLVLRTATAEVSDSLFPVLEEYVFETDEDCKAIGFTKIVRNPSEKNFKACVIHCKKKVL